MRLEKEKTPVFTSVPISDPSEDPKGVKTANVVCEGEEAAHKPSTEQETRSARIKEGCVGVAVADGKLADAVVGVETEMNSDRMTGVNAQALVGNGKISLRSDETSIYVPSDQRITQVLNDRKLLHRRYPGKATESEGIDMPVSERAFEFCGPPSFEGGRHNAVFSSPHVNDTRNLDPNAREFIPLSSSPGCSSCILPVAIPASYILESFSCGDVGPLSYSTNPTGASASANAAFSFGPASSVPSLWESQHGIPAREVVPAMLNYWPPTFPASHVGHSAMPHSGLQPSPFPQQPLPSNIFACPSAGTNTSFISSFCTANGTGVHRLSGIRSQIGKEHLSRALLLTGVSPHLGEIQLHAELAQWGPVRAVDLDKQFEGIVTVYYYDLRHAQHALNDIQKRHMEKQGDRQLRFYTSSEASTENCQNKDTLCSEDIGIEGVCENRKLIKGLIGGRVVWAQYASPTRTIVPDAQNQGTLIIFNLGTDISLEDIRAEFQKYGHIKDIRETPKRHHKFVEFYDVRDAAKACADLDGQEICGRSVKIEFSRPGGQTRRYKDQVRTQVQGGCQVNGSLASNYQQQHVLMGWNGELESIQHFPLATSVPYVCHSLVPNSVASLMPMGLDFQQQQCYVQSEGQSQFMTFVPPYGFSSGNDIVLEGHTRRAFDRSSISFFGPSLETLVDKSETAGVERVVVIEPRQDDGLSLRGMDFTSATSGFGNENFGLENGSHYGRTRSTRRCSPREFPAQYLFDEEKVQLNSDHPRTTLMIRNIPNKYSQQMLLSLLDEHCMRCNKEPLDLNEPQSAYDFVYLPIDFRNRCNLGYAFVNFTTVSATLSFYRAFHDQPWEEFNSKKICQIAYARVQGRAALEEHFRNSRFSCDTDEFLPLMFIPPRNGLERPTPIVAAAHLSGQIGCVGAHLCVLQMGNGFKKENTRDRCRDGLQETGFCKTQHNAASVNKVQQNFVTVD